MAVFGVQLVVSMIMASVLSKLSSRFSFAGMVFGRRLTYFLYPTDNQLKALSGRGPNAFKKPRGNRNKSTTSSSTDDKQDIGFLVSKNLDIELDHAPVTDRDLYSMHYYSELQWLVDFSFVAFVVYCITEVYLTYFAKANHHEFNLSILWLMLTIAFCLKYLVKVTVVYAAGPNGRWIVCFTISMVFLIIAMVTLLIDERLLNFGLVDSYSNFTAAANVHLNKQNIETSGPASILFYRSVIAVVAAFVGGTLAFPGFRLAKTHQDSLTTCTNPFIRIALYVNQVVPFAICLLWFLPLNDQIIRNLPLDCSTTCKEHVFYTWRLLLILAFCVLRMSLIKYHLQAHLNSARDIVDSMKNEAGKIRSLELQKIVSRVYYYLCVVAVQYIAPAIILVCLTLIWKTMSGYRWSDALVFNSRLISAVNSTNFSSTTTTASASAPTAATTAAPTPSSPLPDNIDAYALSKLAEIFSPAVFRSVFSFATWWWTLSWSVNTAFALVYYNFFNKAL